MSAPVTMTLTNPSASGSAAAASEPKTTRRMIATIGKPLDLGFGEVFLGELLEPGPDRRLAGEVGGHPVLSGPRVEIGAEVARGVDLIVGAEFAAQRHQRRPGALEFLAARGRRRPAAASPCRLRRPRPGPGRPPPPRAAGPAPGSARRTTPIPSELAPKSRSSDLVTAFDWLPGTSKPPPVRCSVWRAAKGRRGGR